MSVNKAFKSEKWLDAKYAPKGKQYNRSRRKKPALKCINTGKVVFCDNKKAGAKKSAKAPAKKSAKQSVMSRAKAPSRRPKTKMKKYDFKPHMMYKGKSSKKADTYEEHLKLKKEGYSHTKPKEAVMSRAKAPARRPKTMKRAFKPKPKPKPRSNAMAKAYMSQVGQFLFKRDKEKMSSSDYKKYINKKVKDMSVEEKRQYGKLRTRESRARAKAKKAQN